MSTSFIDAMQTNDVVGENGMPTHSTSGSKVLDFFSSSGAMRKDSENKILTKFSAAFGDDPLLALKALFYARDIRGGQGERRLFRVILRELAENHPDVVVNNFDNITKFGRFDDLEVLQGTPVFSEAMAYWLSEILHAKNALAAKWFPRSGPLFGIGRKIAGMKAGEFRRTLSGLTKVVETQMCQQEWPAINYSHVPSQASRKYRKAFKKHDQERYEAFINAAEKGDVKINAATLYPSDLVKSYMSQWNPKIDNTIEALWKQLPNWLGEDNQGILPVCDVSGSMSGEPMQVSVGLGLYLAERNQGAFKDVVVTFSDSPAFHSISGALKTRVKQLMDAPWGMNTNLAKTMQIMLDRAVSNGVSPDQMPSVLLIISDMQFDNCAEGTDALTMMKKRYATAGYKFPDIVFWNVRDSVGKPAKHNSAGVALVSGYSPSIMKAILGRKPQATPLETMLDVLNSERYVSVVF